MSHSKRNTSLAFFTAHERAELRGTWGSQATRLTRDSFLPFGSCQLCLLPARDPVACPAHAHLFCRECALTNLLAQSQELKRLRRVAEARLRDDRDDREAADAEARERDVEAFERVQAGLEVRAGERYRKGAAGTKRKLDEDADENSSVKLDSERRNDAKRRAAAAEGELSESGDIKAEETSFWIPSRIPDNQKSDLSALKQAPTCPAAEADKPHPFTMKGLVSVRFHEVKSDDAATTATSGTSPTTRTCPSCNKALSNASKGVLAKPCGHVLCKACSSQFQKPAERTAHGITNGDDESTIRCYVCQEDVTPGRKGKRSKEKGSEGVDDGGKKEKQAKVDRGLVELSCEGTGFAGGGRNMVKKQGLSFQC